MQDIIINILIPIITAVLGFLGGCKYTKGKVSKSSIGNNASNNIVIQDSKIDWGWIYAE